VFENRCEPFFCTCHMMDMCTMQKSWAGWTNVVVDARGLTLANMDLLVSNMRMCLQTCVLQLSA
jgi:hypothetical protein